LLPDLGRGLLEQRSKGRTDAEGDENPKDNHGESQRKAAGEQVPCLAGRT